MLLIVVYTFSGGRIYHRPMVADWRTTMGKIELKVLRKLAKERGYSIETSSLSLGRSLTYVHTERGIRLTGNVFTTQTLEPWRRLFGLLDSLAQQGYDGVVHYGDPVIGHQIGERS